MKKFIAYYRVSTDRQGRSGLGLEAQRRAVTARVNGNAALVEEYTEVESGKRNDRPELERALCACRLHQATLVVAKLDRLARDQQFLMSLVDSEVDVVFGDFPDIPPGAMGRFIIQQMAAVAELERGLISERTKAALAASTKKLGGYRGYTPTDADRDKARQVKAAKACARDRDLKRIVDELRGEGASSLRQIADGLNDRGIPTRRGAQWQAPTVQRLLKRLAV